MLLKTVQNLCSVSVPIKMVILEHAEDMTIMCVIAEYVSNMTSPLVPISSSALWQSYLVCTLHV
jgi:hypothetical protein